MKNQIHPMSRFLKVSFAIALLAVGFSRGSAASSSASSTGTEISNTTSSDTHFIYPGLGIGGIGDDE